MKYPKLTISVAVYNVEPYMERLSRSLYEQTLDEIEIIFVDDCTPDKSIEIALQILKEYPERQNQVKVIHHEKNLGIALTKKDGITHASGEYVIIIDGDDYIDTRMAELMYLKAKSSDADMVICDYYLVDGEKITYKTNLRNEVIGNGQNVKDDIINRKNTPYMWCKLIRKSILDTDDMVWPQWSLGEDTVMCAMYALHSNIICHINKPLYYYCKNENSVTSAKCEEKILSNYHSFCNSINLLFDFLERKGLSEKYSCGIFWNKYIAKMIALKFTSSSKLQRLYITTYKEINKDILFGNKYHKSTVHNWIAYILISIRCYNHFNNLKRFFKDKDRLTTSSHTSSL